MVATLSTVQPKTEFGDIQAVTKRVFSGITEIVCIDQPEPCFPCTCALLKQRYAQYGEGMDAKDPRKVRKIRRQHLWEVESWRMVERLGPHQYDDLNSPASQAAHALLYCHLLLNEVLGQNSDETENLQMACNMLHMGVPLGLLPRRPYPLLLYVF